MLIWIEINYNIVCVMRRRMMLLVCDACCRASRRDSCQSTMIFSVCRTVHWQPPTILINFTQTTLTATFSPAQLSNDEIRDDAVLCRAWTVAMTAVVCWISRRPWTRRTLAPTSRSARETSRASCRAARRTLRWRSCRRGTTIDSSYLPWCVALSVRSWLDRIVGNCRLLLRCWERWVMNEE